jgi:hypothetical protein
VGGGGARPVLTPATQACHPQAPARAAAADLPAAAHRPPQHAEQHSSEGGGAAGGALLEARSAGLAAAVWANTARNPRLRHVELPALRASLALPTQVAMASCALRLQVRRHPLARWPRPPGSRVQRHCRRAGRLDSSCSGPYTQCAAQQAPCCVLPRPAAALGLGPLLPLLLQRPHGGGRRLPPRPAGAAAAAQEGRRLDRVPGARAASWPASCRVACLRRRVGSSAAAPEGQRRRPLDLQVTPQWGQISQLTYPLVGGGEAEEAPPLGLRLTLPREPRLAEHEVLRVGWWDEKAGCWRTDGIRWGGRCRPVRRRAYRGMHAAISAGRLPCRASASPCYLRPLLRRAVHHAATWCTRRRAAG